MSGIVKWIDVAQWPIIFNIITKLTTP